MNLNTTFLILTLFTIFVSSVVRAEDATLVFSQLLRENCTIETNTIEGNKPSFLIDGSKIHFLNSELSSGCGQKTVWIFDEKDNNLIEPKALVYSTYTYTLTDEVEDIWEPIQTLIVADLRVGRSCVVSEIRENADGELNWQQSINLAKNIENQSCL